MKCTYAARFKTRNIDSQRGYTRFRTLQNQVENKIKASQLQYNAARNAILALCGPGSWENSFRILQPEDIRGLGEHALRVEEKETDYQMQKLAGLSEGEGGSLEGVMLLLEEPLPPTQFIPNLALGEGNRTISWIWHSTGGKELENSETQACLFFQYFFL